MDSECDRDPFLPRFHCPSPVGWVERDMQNPQSTASKPLSTDTASSLRDCRETQRLISLVYFLSKCGLSTRLAPEGRQVCFFQVCIIRINAVILLLPSCFLRWIIVRVSPLWDLDKSGFGVTTNLSPLWGYKDGNYQQLAIWTSILHRMMPYTFSE